MTRRRNLLTNLKAIELVKEGVIEYLLLSQDDAKPQGIHVADRIKLLQEIQKQGLEQKIAVQPGADEVSMILLARALTQVHGYRPRIRVVYSSDSIRAATMPFEDRPLHQTVSQHIRATGADEVADGQSADIYLYVYVSRHDKGKAEPFAAEIDASVRKVRQVVVADIDPRGDVQGSDPEFAESLNRRKLFFALTGYAAWNTAANTIGTALSQGVVFSTAEDKLFKNPELSIRSLSAQRWFTLHRVMDDYYFHTLVRAKTNAYLKQEKKSSLIMNDEKTRQAEAFSRKLMQRYFETVTKTYFKPIQRNPIPKTLSCQASNLRFSLPWNRMFEASIDFDVHCDYF